MKKVVCIVLIVLIVLSSFLSCNPSFYYDNGFIIPSKEIQEYTLNKILSCFQENQESFHDIASIILKNEKIVDAMKEKNDDDWAIYVKNDHRFFTDDEWETIYEFFQKTGPYQIMRSLKYGNDIVYFVYMSDRKNSKSFEIYYVPDNSEQTIMDHKWKNQDAFQIEEFWWIIYECQGDGSLDTLGVTRGRFS